MIRSFILAFACVAALAPSALAQQAATQPPPIDQMSTQQLRDAVGRLRPYVMNGGVRPSQAPGCESAESRQLDFWLGEWDVSPSGSTAVLAESSITLHDQGCVIIENWRPLMGAHGFSINVYDATDQQWHQTYAGAGGRRSVYAGAYTDGAMRLGMVTGAPGTQRMSYQRMDENTVRQWGERLDPATNTWVGTFDFTYRRRAGTAFAR
jgi:hypothetical protein